MALVRNLSLLSKPAEISKKSGLLETGGQEGQLPPPTFAENYPKLLKNMGFSCKFISFAPNFWSCPPHSYTSSNTPAIEILIKGLDYSTHEQIGDAECNNLVLQKSYHRMSNLSLLTF